MSTFLAVLGGVFFGILGAVAMIVLFVILFFGYALHQGDQTGPTPSCVLSYDSNGNMRVCE